MCYASFYRHSAEFNGWANNPAVKSIPESETKMLETHKYTRKPFHVDAVQVTAENINDVAVWCGGKVHTLDNAVAEKNRTSQYIKVNVPRAANDRQTQAFVGDWVLKAGNGFKCYNQKAFQKSFDLVTVIAPTLPRVVPVEVQAEERPVPVTNPIEMNPAQFAARFKPRSVLAPTEPEEVVDPASRPFPENNVVNSSYGGPYGVGPAQYT